MKMARLRLVIVIVLQGRSFVYFRNPASLWDPGKMTARPPEAIQFAIRHRNDV
jgi:hypothetical protein